MKLDAMLPVVRKQLPLKAHAHRADDICTAIRIAKEFDLKLTLEHVTEGQFILPQLQAANVPLAVGPNLHANSKFEIRNMTFTTPGVLSKAGLQVSIVTDAPIVPLKYLAMSAGLAVKSGMDHTEASVSYTHLEKFAMAVAGVIGFIQTLLTPINFLFSLWKKLLSMMFKVENDDSMTQEELLTIVEEAQNEGDLEAHESDLICAAIEFNDCLLYTSRCV